MTSMSMAMTALSPGMLKIVMMMIMMMLMMMMIMMMRTIMMMLLIMTTMICAITPEALPAAPQFLG